MIEKIQNLIEDNTSMDVTHNQVIMGLVLIASIIIVIAFFIFSSNGPKKDPDNFTPKPPSANMPIHIPGQS